MFNKDKYPFCSSGYKYALDIINGDIIANIFIISACKRFLSDLEKSKLETNSFYFNIDRAEALLRVCQKFKHVKGRWANPFIIFEPWQNFIVMNIGGFFERDTNERRFRTAHVEVARGNAKSTLASILGLIFMCVDRPNGNQVFSAATKKEQAKIVLDDARAMALRNKEFLKVFGVDVMAHEILHKKSNSYFRALSSDSKSLDGLLPILAIIDELHAHKDRFVYDVMDSAMSKRNDSLLFVITTAGFNTTGIGYTQSAYAKKIALGEIVDETFFAMPYTLDKKNEELGIMCDDDWEDENNWIKANPNLDVSVDIKNLKSKALKAANDPSSLNNFLVKHLNVWVNASDPFFNLAKWDLCADETLDMRDFRDSACWVGLDLSSTIDITTQAYVFFRDGKYYIFEDSFVPQARIDETTNEHYKQWINDGELTATPGEAISHEQQQKHMLNRKNNLRFNGVHFDKWHATEFAQRMLAKKVNMIEFGMRTAYLSEPTKRLDALIREGKVVHNGSKFLRWCMGNVVVKYDAVDNVFPRKDSNEMKIDPVIAIIMAIAGFIQTEEEKKSVYEYNDIMIL